jgi:hypothetical protein
MDRSVRMAPPAMAGDARPGECSGMLRAQVTCEHRRDGTTHRVLTLGNDYGLTADVAHLVLLTVLTASKRPVVIDAAGHLHPFLRSRIRALTVWSEPER